MGSAMKSVSLGNRIRTARNSAGLTQSELAVIVGVSQAAISEIERGESARTAYLPEISRACGTDIHWLAFGGVDPADSAMTPKESSARPSQELSFCLDGIGFSGMPLERVSKYMAALSDLLGGPAVFIRMTENSIVFYDGSSASTQGMPEGRV